MKTRFSQFTPVSVVAAIGVALLPVMGIADTATRAELENAWLSFNHARGEASLILGDVNHPTANEVFRNIPDVGADSLEEDRLQLGFDLFNEARLSRDGSIACASCHIGLMGGVDRRPLPFGIGGTQGSLNAPTIFNAALNFRQFWDGRALTLQEQALGPIENAAEFGHDLAGAVAAIQAVPDYEARFDSLYPDGITAANLGHAIAYYETMNFTGISSPFLNQWQEDGEALSPQVRRGQQRFVDVGCASCHNGVNLGGNSFQALGVAAPWYGSGRVARDADDGLYTRTGREQDRHVFKVPTLHNVAITGPWMHDGSVTSLQQAVDQMARHQSGRYLDDADIDDIVAFLRALGDSQGMIGDCAASGNYGVTMNCSVRQRTANGEQGNAVASTLPDSSALAEQHQQAYAEARARVAAAPLRIAEEMQRIRSGRVAHYDFLQYEHIEMLRHARALSFPPATLVAGEREALLKDAAEWQESAAQYELFIADFLRNQAIVSGARANYEDLLRILSADADEKQSLRLIQARQSLLAYYDEPAAETRADLERATDELNDINLNSQRLDELQLQVQMLVETLVIPQV